MGRPCYRQGLKPLQQFIRVLPGEHQAGVRDAGMQRRHCEKAITACEIDGGPSLEVEEDLLPQKSSGMECHATGSLVPALRGGHGGLGVPGFFRFTLDTILTGRFPPTGIKPLLP